MEQDLSRERQTGEKTITQETHELGWKTWTEAKQMYKDRTNWRRNIAALWITLPEEDI